MLIHIETRVCFRATICKSKIFKDQVSRTEVFEMKRIGLKAVVCLAAAGMLFAMAGCQFGKKEFDLSNYVDFNFEGYDGEGVMTYEVDYKGLMNDLEEAKVKFDKSDVKDSIKVEPEKTTGLSNGDEIKIELDIKSKLEKNVKATFICEDYEITVKGLEERKDFDPFAYVKVIFSGVGPNGTATLEKDGNSPITNISYKITSDNRGKKLKNGDTVTVKASVSGGLEKVCYDNGYKLTNDTKEYTVEGLDEYATSISQITPAMFDELKKQAEDTFKSSIASWAEDSKLDSVEYVGSYFLTVKDGANKSKKNIIYTILHIHATTVAGEFDYYFYVAFNNVVVKADGSNNIYEITDVQYPTGSEYSSTAIKQGSGKNKRYVIGYKDIDTLFNSVIRKNSQYYEIENNIQGTTQTTETTTAETSAADTSASETSATETT